MISISSSYKMYRLSIPCPASVFLDTEQIQERTALESVLNQFWLGTHSMLGTGC